MMKQTKFWALLFAALAILGGGAFLLLRGHGQTGQTAVIRIDGEVYQRIDLRAVTIPYDIEVQTDWGTNTVHVESDGVSVTQADCPDLLCVQQGKITTSAILIVTTPTAPTSGITSVAAWSSKRARASRSVRPLASQAASASWIFMART